MCRYVTTLVEDTLLLYYCITEGNNMLIMLLEKNSHEIWTSITFDIIYYYHMFVLSIYGND